METEKDAVLKVGGLDFSLKELLDTIEKLAAEHKLKFSEDDTLKIKTFSVFVIAEGILMGRNKERTRIKKECEAAEVEFQKIQAAREIIEKLSLIITPAKGEC